jgi:hypothetical protein
MHPLRYFKSIFPDHRLIALADELRYRFQSVDCANAYEYVARRLILAKGLPLVIDVEQWTSGGKAREIAMVVKEAPDAYNLERANSCVDEAGDGVGLDGGWWNVKGE